MFSVILRARPDSRALAASLGPMVRGVVEGVVGSASLVFMQADAQMRAIADEAGARLVVASTWPEGFAKAVAPGKGGGMIVLDTGVILGPDFWPMIADLAPVLADRPAITASPRAGGLLEALRYCVNSWRGVPNPGQVIVLPVGMAHDLARNGGDPLRHAYGRALLRLSCQSVRIKGSASAPRRSP